MSIGQTLATARIDAGLSIEAISDRTRIRRTLVTAIEGDDFSRCGGMFYARGHVKAIAVAVGIDPATLLLELDSTGAGLTPAPRASTIFAAERVSRRERRNPNWSAVMAAALVSVLVIAGWQLVGADTDPRPVETIAGARVPATPGRAPVPVPVPVPAPTTAPDAGPGVAPGAGVEESAAPTGVVAAAPRTTVELAVATATAASWLSVTDSTNTTVFSGTIALGEVVTYSDPRRLRVVMGNAGGLSLTVNGVAVGTPGAPGQVVRQDFGVEDPVAG